MNTSVEIVLVLYKTTLDESLTYQSFTKNIKNNQFEYELIIYNNSPEIEIKSSSDYIIINSVDNNMLSGAYNYALENAISSNRKWLLLLDQDTILTERYFSELNNFIVSGNEAVVAVPILQQGDIHLSPISYSPRLGPYYFFRNLKQLNPNTKGCISGFNSAALINVSFMTSIGGFSNYFPLDMLDHWYFYKIHIAGKKVFILNATLEQELSLLDMDKSMSIVRYNSYLKSLKQFTKDLKFPAMFILYFKLFEFIASQIIRKNKRKYLKTTLKAFFDLKLIERN